MRTPGAFRPDEKYDFRVNRTPCVVCGKPLRPGQTKFHSETCRWKADSKTRQTISRIARFMSRRQIIQIPFQTLFATSVFLEASPDSSSARRSYTSSVLDELDKLLFHRGPNDTAVRSYVRLRADAVRLAFETEPSTNIDDHRNYVRALEILRDAGAERLDEINKLIEYAWHAVHFYHAHRDLLRLAKALQALANTYRLSNDERNGRRMTRYSWNIASEKFSRSRDAATLTVVHQSAFWDLRLFGEYLEGPVAEKKCREIVRLANEVNTPGVLIETSRELAGYWAQRGKLDRASGELKTIDTLRSAHPTLVSYGAPTFLRPEIELRLSSPATRDEGIDLIETKYAALYNSDRHLYYYRQLRKWQRKYGLTLEIPKPEYATAILAYLPRN
jgi:hypothetical protein